MGALTGIRAISGLSALVSRPKISLAELQSELAAAAVSCGGAGLGNWFVVLGDNYSGTTAANQGLLGLDGTGVGGIATDAPLLNDRKGWLFDGSSECLIADSLASVGTSRVFTVFTLYSQPFITSNERLWAFAGSIGCTSSIYRSGFPWRAYRRGDSRASRNQQGTLIPEDNRVYLRTLRSPGISVQMYENGVLDTLDSSNWNTGATTIEVYTIGAYRAFIGDTPSAFFTGSVYLNAVCDLDLGSAASGSFATARERAAAAINAYYGLPL